MAQFMPAILAATAVSAASSIITAAITPSPPAPDTHIEDNESKRMATAADLEAERRNAATPELVNTGSELGAPTQRVGSPTIVLGV